MTADRRGIWFGRIAGELERLLHHRFDVRLDHGEVVGVGNAVVFDEALAEHVDGVALDPGVDLRLGPVGADHRVALVVADSAIGLGLDQGRAAARAGPLGGLLHREPHGEDIVAVDRDARHAVAVGLAGDLGVEGDRFERRGRRVEVVLAHEHRRRPVDRCEVEALVESAMVGSAIAEERHSDVVPSLLAGAHADADRMPDAGADDAVGAEQAHRLVVEVHGAATAAADPVGLAEQLRHDPPGFGALGQRMAVSAMRRGDPVGAAKMRADSDPGCLLADIEMQEAGGFAFAAGDLRHSFEAAQQHHLFEQFDQDGAVGQIALAHLLRSTAHGGTCHRYLPTLRRSCACRSPIFVSAPR